MKTVKVWVAQKRQEKHTLHLNINGMYQLYEMIQSQDAFISLSRDTAAQFGGI